MKILNSNTLVLPLHLESINYQYHKMKQILVLAVCFMPFLVGAQKLDKKAEELMTTPAISFQEQQYNLGQTTATAITVHVTGTDKEYSKSWKEFLKTSFAIEGKKNSGFLSAQGISVSQWSTSPLNFHYKIEKDGSGAKLITITEQNGAFVSAESNPEVAVNVKSSITGQLKNFYVQAYDKYIGAQQKYYNGQVKDMEKLRKKLDKTHSKIDSSSKSKQKSEKKLRDASSSSSKADGDIKSLNAKLQNDRKAIDQAQKEVDAQTIAITEKEGEYNRLNYSGNLNTKEGEKVIKALSKLRKKQEKLQGNLAKANASRTKTENALLKAEQSKSKQEAKITSLQSDIDSQDVKQDNLKTDLSGVQKEINDKQKLIDTARNTLDKLKTAKEGLVRF